jgi:hypothetical protein
MPNGAVATLLVPESTPDTTPDTALISVPTKIELELGHAVVQAAGGLAAMIVRYRSGDPIDHALRVQVGERIATLYELRMATAGQIDFPAAVFREGKRELQAREPDGFRGRWQHVDEILKHLLVVIEHVVVVEQAWAETTRQARN